jgi:heat shock protein beta
VNWSIGNAYFSYDLAQAKLVEDQLKAEKKAQEKEKAKAEAEGKKPEEKKDEKKESKFIKFYENFGKNIKLGVIEDTANRGRLAKLLRFYTLKNAKDLISLDDYIAGMKDKQEEIYYIAGEEKDAGHCRELHWRVYFPPDYHATR